MMKITNGTNKQITRISGGECISDDIVIYQDTTIWILINFGSPRVEHVRIVNQPVRICVIRKFVKFVINASYKH